MVKGLYKKIVRKLNLSYAQLEELETKLTEDYICSGPFISGGNTCPSTTALVIKEGQVPPVQDIRRVLNDYTISNIELWLFYIIFDIPSMISSKFFRKSLKLFREVTKELRMEK